MLRRLIRACLAASVVFLGITDAPAQCPSEIFVAESGADRILKYDVASLSSVIVASTGLSGPDGLAYDATSNLLFVTERTAGELSSVDLSTGTVTRICTGLGTPAGVAIHPAGFLLVADSAGGGLIGASPLGCNTVPFITGLDGPAGVVVHPTLDVAYVTEKTSGEVSEVDLVDGTVTTLVSGLGQPSGLTIDRIGSTLYVTQEGGSQIHAIDIASRTVAFTVSAPASAGIAVDPGERLAYVAQALLGWLFEQDLESGAGRFIATGLSSPAGVALRTVPCAHGLVEPSRRDPTPLSRIAACVDLDLTGRSENLGSYGATLRWDPAVLRFLGYSPGNPPFNTPVVNTSQAASGTLSFADADSTGAGGRIFLLCAALEVLGEPGSSSPLDLGFTSLHAAGTFADLRPSIPALDDSLLARQPDCTIGDVIPDLRINSGDALVILSNEIGLPLPSHLQTTIALGCGDADRSGTTNSIDANLVLTHEVGLPIDPGFPIGREGNRFIDSCPGTLVGATASSALTDATVTAEPSGTLVARLLTSVDGLRPGQEFDLNVSLDTGADGPRVGSYAARLRWDARALTLLEARGGSTAGFGSPLMNQAGVESGELRFAQATPVGGGGAVEILRLRFRARRALPRLLGGFALEFSSLGAPGPRFEDLLPRLRSEPAAAPGPR